MEENERKCNENFYHPQIKSSDNSVWRTDEIGENFGHFSFFDELGLNYNEEYGEHALQELMNNNNINNFLLFDSIESKDNSNFSIEFLSEEKREEEDADTKNTPNVNINNEVVLRNDDFKVYIRPSRKKNTSYSEFFPENASVFPHWYQIVILYPVEYKKRISPLFFLKIKKTKGKNNFLILKENGYLNVREYDPRRTKREFVGRKFENRMVQFSKKASTRKVGGSVLRLCIEDEFCKQIIWESNDIKKLYVRRSKEEDKFWEKFLNPNLFKPQKTYKKRKKNPQNSQKKRKLLTLKREREKNEENPKKQKLL